MLVARCGVAMPYPAILLKSWLSNSLRSTTINTVGFSVSPPPRNSWDGNRYHGEGLAAALRMPDKPAPFVRIVNPLNHLLHGTGLVLAQHNFGQRVVPVSGK